MATRDGTFNVRRSAFWAILLPFLLVVSVLLILWLQSRAYVQSTERLLKTERIIADFYELKKNIVDMETSVRGYLLYDYRAEYLEPYANSVVAINPLMDEIYKLLEPPQRVLFAKLQKKINLWMEDMRMMIAQKDYKAISESFKRPGRLEKMREIRTDIVDFIDIKEGLREMRIAEQKKESELTIYVSIALGMLLSSMLSAILWRGIISTARAYEKALLDIDAANEKLRMHNEKLEETVDQRTVELTSSNSELEAFCYSVSHDLRAPLRGIDGFSQALMEDYPDNLDARGKQYLHFIREGVQKMGKLIDDLLNLSRISRLDAASEDIDLIELVKEVIEEARRAHPGESRNIILPKKGSFRVRADRGLIKVALENLVSNAWKFTSKTEAPSIEFGMQNIGGQNTFFIRDNGAGFDMKFVNKLFGAFQRLHTSLDFSGTGIGLATVKRIMLKHGGDIWAEAKVNQGATFYFRLPQNY